LPIQNLNYYGDIMGSFEKLRSLLKKKYPDYNISVRRVNLKNAYGTWHLIDKKKNQFLIKIDKNSTCGEQIDALLHEFAHCLVAHKTFEGESQHKAAWGQAYAKLYRLYEDNILNNDSDK